MFRIESDDDISYHLLRNDISVFYDGESFIGEVEDNEYSFDMVVRGILNLLSSQNNILMLHSVGFLYKDMAYILAGEEGKGKSTIANELLENNIVILSDEINFVSPISDGGSYAWGSPFMGEVFSPRPKEKFLLSTLMVISEHGPNRCKEIPKDKFITKFMRNIINYGSTTNMSLRFFYTTLELLEGVNFCALSFKKNEFWRWFCEQNM